MPSRCSLRCLSKCTPLSKPSKRALSTTCASLACAPIPASACSPLSPWFTPSSPSRASIARAASPLTAVWIPKNAPAAMPSASVTSASKATACSASCSSKPPTTPSAVTTTSAASTSAWRSEEHTSELQSRQYLVCRLLLEKKKKQNEDSGRQCEGDRRVGEKKLRIVVLRLHEQPVRYMKSSIEHDELALSVIARRTYRSYS